MKLPKTALDGFGDYLVFRQGQKIKSEDGGVTVSQVQDAAELALSGSSAENNDTEARRALWGSALGYAMDGFDLLILGFMLRVISADLHLTPAEGASLVTATLIGAVLGGWIFSQLGIARFGFIYSLAAATLGAVILVAFARLFSGGGE